MASDRFTLGITVRLLAIFGAMLALVFLIGRESRLFSVLAVLLALAALIAELFHALFRTHRVIGSFLESIRSGDVNTHLQARTAGLGFGALAGSAREIVRDLATARIEKETRFAYLQAIMEHILTGVMTLDKDHKPELVNPVALNILGLYNTRQPAWNDIARQAPAFADAVLAMGENGRQMVSLKEPRDRQLLVLVHGIRVDGKKIRVVTFQDIEPEIQKKEMESWETISRIMAHEIMNSLTPLSSLTETGLMLLGGKEGAKPVKDLAQEQVDNLYTALRTISDRNAALERFIGNYRQLSRLPPPEQERTNVAQLVNSIAELYQASCREQGISCHIRHVPGQLHITGDPAQLKQVLINLVRNAMEATADIPEPVLEIRVRRIMDEVSIEVSDNGPGIAPDMLDRIFVPFYSSKPEGSGIGLSLSRQIVRNHGGRLLAESKTGQGSTFRMVLPLTVG